MTAFQLYILLIAQFFAIYGIDSLSDAEKKESIKDLGAALEIQYNGSYLKKVKSFTELDPAFQELCIQWHDAFDKIKELLYIWQILRFAILEKKELEKDFTNANELKNFIEYKPEFSKEIDGTKLKITKAMNAISAANDSMRNEFANSQSFTQTISIVDGDKWNKQIKNWIKFIKNTQTLDIKNNENLKKFNLLAAITELDEAILLRPKVVFKDCKSLYSAEAKRLCSLWETFYKIIDHFLKLWDDIKMMHKKNKRILEKSKKQSSKRDQIIELETDPSHLLTFRPKFFQKMEKGGQILTISEAMKAIQMASRAFFISEKAQECPTFIEFDGQWQKQVDSWEEWHKQNIKKMPRMAKADMVIHHALTNARKRVSKRLR